MRRGGPKKAHRQQMPRFSKSTSQKKLALSFRDCPAKSTESNARANVFVGTVNRRTREKVIAYVRRHGEEMGMLVIASDDSVQGFFVQSYGENPRNIVSVCGLNLIAEKWEEPEPA